MFNFFGNKKREEELELENRVLKIEVQKLREILTDVFSKIDELKASHSNQIEFMQKSFIEQESYHVKRAKLYEQRLKEKENA